MSQKTLYRANFSSTDSFYWHQNLRCQVLKDELVQADHSGPVQLEVDEKEMKKFTPLCLCCGLCCGK